MKAQQLKNSILQMAIQGKLVPQDPNDEPASVLLERIRKEKEQMIKEGKIKKEKNPSVIFKGSDNLYYEKICNNKPTCIEDDIIFDIPESWGWIRLSNVGTWGSGATPLKGSPEFYKDGTIPWLLTGDLNNGYIESVPNYITEYALEKTSVKLNPVGSVLIAMYGATIGKLGILNIPATTNQACCACQVFPGVYNEFLFYFLMAHKERFIKQGEGGAQPNISKEKILKTLMPLPPLNEQKRIVNCLKELLPFVNKYNEKETELSKLNDAFPELLKKSILQQVIQGKLVPQNPNDEPASVLVERIRQEKQQLIKEGKIKKDKNESIIYRRDNSHYEKRGSEEVCIDDEIPFEVPDSWVWSRIRNICTNIVDCPHSTPKYYPEDTGFYGIDTTCINSDGTIQGFRYVDENAYTSRTVRLSPQEGDIVYTREGSIGRAAVLPDVDNICLGQRVMLLRLSELVNTSLYQQILMSPVVLDAITGKTRGIGAKHINVSDVCNALVPVPPLSEQHRIVEKQRELFDKITLI